MVDGARAIVAALHHTLGQFVGAPPVDQETTRSALKGVLAVAVDQMPITPSTGDDGLALLRLALRLVSICTEWIAGESILAITLDALEVSLWQGDADVQIFALTALVRLVGSGRVRLTHHPECAPILVRILRRHVHPGTRQEFAKLASVTPSDVEEYDERSRELMEKAAAVKIFWDAMSQSDGV